MGRRVYLHIGTMKSATSYIGQLCELNAEYLKDSGLLWPTEGLRYDAVRDFFGRTVREADFTGSWRVLARQIRQFPGDVLISNEMLAAFNVHQITKLMRALSQSEVHVVVTARDPARVIPSHWQTTLKNGGTHPWREFASAVCTQPTVGREVAGEAPADQGSPDGSAETYSWFWRRHDIAAIIERWGLFVDPERLTVVTVPPAGSDAEMVAGRFGSVVGVDLIGLAQPEWGNPSLGAHSAELIRRLNEQMPKLSPYERSYAFRGALAGSLVSARSAAEPRFGLSQPQQDWVVARAHGMLARITQAGTRVEGDLADLIPDEHPPTGTVDPEDSSDTDLLEAATHGLTGMVQAYAEVRRERDDVAKYAEARRAKYDRPQAPADRGRQQIESPGGRGRAVLRRSATLRKVVRRLRAEGARVREP